MSEIELQPLRVLCAIIETRSMSRAAGLVGIKQPAASYLLARLREVPRDPLFMKSSKGMAPTPLAYAVYQQVRRGIDMLDSALSPVGFDPRPSERNFRLAMSDIGEMVFLPPILRRLRTIAPNVTVEVIQVPLLQLPPALDFGIGNLPEVYSETSHTTVFREHAEGADRGAA